MVKYPCELIYRLSINPALHGISLPKDTSGPNTGSISAIVRLLGLSFNSFCSQSSLNSASVTGTRLNQSKFHSYQTLRVQLIFYLLLQPYYQPLFLCVLSLTVITIVFLYFHNMSIIDHFNFILISIKPL